jgi:histidinol dehydrogenase
MKYFKIKGNSLSEELIEFLEEQEQTDIKIEKTVLEMMKNIRTRGFSALVNYSKKFDNFELTKENFRVSKTEIDSLASKIKPELSKSLEIAVKRITDFHNYENQSGFAFTDNMNNKMGQKILPINSAAVYVPGGRALYPSTLYMTVIPALIAGVKRIILLSPPRTFVESPEVARLVQILGINEIYRIGGAQAIIAAAYGINELEPVDKIVGPGNIFVAKAKQLAFGKVDIDMIAGPSEILVIADTDKQSDIPLIAMDLLSQAEHDPMARSILIGNNNEYLMKIKKCAYEYAEKLPAKINAIKSLDNRGIIIECRDKWTAVSLSNKLAPEHLEIFSDDPDPIFEKVENAGSVFLGKFTPESAGDYLAGPNHVLPTSGTSRFFSPLGVYNFQKRLSYISMSEKSLSLLKDNIAEIARSEGLEAHARSAEIRFEDR